jgi:hypothetical protein
MDVHRVAKISYNPLRTQPAGLFFVGIAPLAVQQLVAVNRHASAANPVVTVSRMYVVVVCQYSRPRTVLAEYQVVS